MSLKERLATRKRPTATYRLRIDDTTEIERELVDARTALNLGNLTGDAERIEKARELVGQAEAKLNGCYESITLAALKPEDFEALLDAHPVRPNTDDEAWNTDTFPRACFLECAPDEMTVAEWEAFLADACSDGEQTALFNTAIAVNVRVPDPTVPKDLMGMLG